MQIRIVREEDAAEIADIYRPAVTDTPISFELEPPDAAEIAHRITEVLKRTPWIVCTSDDRVLGYAYASRHRERAGYQWSVEVSAYVHRDARRMGIARGLYNSLFAMLTYQGFRNAYAGITLPNKASVSLHEAVGFKLIGRYHAVGYKLGAWHDTGWFERGLAAHDVPPALPRALPECIEDPEFQIAMRAGESCFSAPASRSE